MSTTVNVRVVENQVTEKLKEQSEANRFAEENGSGTQLSPAEQQAQQGAAARAVEAARLSTDQASFKKRDPLRDPIGRREEGGGGPGGNNPSEPGTLPDGTPVEDGALIQLGRVGIRWNSNRTRAFVYPWGIEGALGRRLSDDYNTAKSEAFAVGVELEFDAPRALPPPELPRRFGDGPSLSGYEGRLYEVSPYEPSTKRIPRFYSVINGKTSIDITFSGLSCLFNSTDDPRFDRYDFKAEYKISFGSTSYCYYYAGYNADQDFGEHVYKSFVQGAVRTSTAESTNDVYEFFLPVGGDKVLAVFITRALAQSAYVRFLYEYTGTTFVVESRDRTLDPSFGVPLTEISTGVTITGGVVNPVPEEFIDSAIRNDVQCVLVEGAIARKVTPSPPFIAACDSLVKKIESGDRTGSIDSIDQIQLSLSLTEKAFLFDFKLPEETKEETFFTPTFKVFEPSNLPKAPYYDIPANQQVLAKQLGIGYLETDDHGGPFYTPAVFDWLKGSATFTSSYSNVVPSYYRPGDQTNPFPGVYLSTFRLSSEQIEMRATVTQPQNVTTAHQPLDWVTVNTGSRYGDYFVWDWGNPEYCRQQLEQLGMGFL